MRKKITVVAIAIIATILQAESQNSIIDYQRQIAINPTNITALLNMAHYFFSNQQFDEAIIHYKKALRTDPYNYEACFNLATALMQHKETEAEALKYFGKALQVDPSSADAYYKSAIILENQQKKDEAINHYEQAAQINPQLLPAYTSLAKLYRETEQFDKAILAYTNAINLQPEQVNLFFALGYTYNMCGRTKDAIDIYEKIVAAHPRNIQALYNLGYSFKIYGDIDKTVTMYKKTLEINPGYDAARYGLALAYLYNGNFKSGWEYYTERLKREKRNAETLRHLIATNNVQGKSIFLFPEGGFGDSIQFIRYAKKLHDMGVIVTVSVQKPLIPLFSGCDYIDILIGKDNKQIKYHDKATIMSMPAIFNDTEETFPKEIPYIHPDPALEKKWGTYFAQNNSFKIGLCWEADIKNDVSRLPVARRSIPLEKLSPLATCDNVTFYSLQKSDGSSELEHLPEEFIVHDFGPDFDNTSGPFMDTAAIMKHLDLVITVDTSIAHLAGALGVPVWTMLPYNTDWRWIINRTDSPWYPTMKIFKQEKPFDWDSVVKKMYHSLTQLQMKKETNENE